MRFIGAEEIRSVLTFPLLVDALEAAHRRPRIEIQDAMLGGEGAQYFVRHAVDPGRFMASKLITSFPGNLHGGAGLPAVQAVCVLFDGCDGQPLAVVDGTEITYWRTAADSALGARLLAPEAPATLLVVGAGPMAIRLVRAHRAVRPTLKRVLVWNRTRAGAIALAARMTEEGIDAAACDDLAAATREADIVSTCTRSRTPLVHGADLKPGSHLDLVGGYSPETREADDDAMRRARVFVDRRESAFDGVGDILQPIASGAMRETDVLGDLYDLVGGSVAGRTSPRRHHALQERRRRPPRPDDGRVDLLPRRRLVAEDERHRVVERRRVHRHVGKEVGLVAEAQVLERLARDGGGEHIDVRPVGVGAAGQHQVDRQVAARVVHRQLHVHRRAERVGLEDAAVDPERAVARDERREVAVGRVFEVERVHHELAGSASGP